MQRWHFSLTLVLCLLVCLSPAQAANSNGATPSSMLSSAQREKSVDSHLTLPKLDVTAWALMEASSGWVVAGQHIREPLPPASITKLMTNFVVFRVSGRLLEGGNCKSFRAWRRISEES